ncbi:MAG: efflux RND transporter periplasmic adaptor subunit [Desulfosarcina sp.]|nr:efflux RND transporter periplasmic adaptor subunit [Desulfosarcina sp.]MBC2743427.1 efflux RND transporter periplasmic adaptor subunit [Desulfosarcina sp.]MBC2766337.1 efflux RND transporter periplasmic adaptor subunit [Desulfosarcina sp.]
MEKLQSEPKPVNERRPLLKRLWGFFPTLVVILLVGVIFLLSGRIRSEGEIIKERTASGMRNERPQTNVITMEMVPATLRERLSLPGTVKPWIALKIVAEVNGKIVEKLVSEGQRVKKGDILARIDDRDYKNALASSQASYQVALATQKRLKELFEEKVSTHSQIDDIAARVKTSRAAMDNAALALERCAIRAPFDGVVNRFYIETGQYLGIADPVAEVLQIDRVKIEVGIPESDVDKVRRLEHFSVKIDALGGKRFQGTRHYLYKNSDNFARLYNLEIAVDNPDGEILPDMFTRVEIVKTEVSDGLGVPLYSLITRNEASALYVVKDGVVRLTPVEVGIQDGWQVEISQGLKPGDHVVVVGQRQIDDGEAVNVTRTIREMGELSL